MLTTVKCPDQNRISWLIPDGLQIPNIDELNPCLTKGAIALEEASKRAVMPSF